MRKVYANVNLLLRKFSKCSVNVKCFLFKKYCFNLWWFDCTKAELKKLKIAYNNSLRRFMFSPWRNSAAEMFVNLGIHLFDEMLRIFYVSFRSRVTASQNQLICSYVVLTAVIIQNCGHGGTAYYIYSQRHYLSYAPALCKFILYSICIYFI